MYRESTVIISVTEEHEGSALDHNKPIFTIWTCSIYIFPKLNVLKKKPRLLLYLQCSFLDLFLQKTLF